MCIRDRAIVLYEAGNCNVPVSSLPVCLFNFLYIIITVDTVFEDISVTEFMYLVFTYMLCESYHRCLRSLVLCCDSF